MPQRPMWMDRMLYTGYCVASLRTPTVRRNLRRTAQERRMSRAAVLADVARAFRRSDVSPADYFVHRVWEATPGEASQRISMLTMYRYQRLVNDPPSGLIFRDKVRFRQAFREFVVNESFDITTQTDFAAWLDRLRPTRLAVKDPRGQNGLGVRLVDVSHETDGWRVDGVPESQAVADARARGTTLIETTVPQHPAMAAPNPRSVNTVRVMTRVTPTGDSEIVGAFLRVGNGTDVDNLVSGGLGALVDETTGVVRGPLLDRDPWHRDRGDHHPATGHLMDGMAIPYWPDVVAMVHRASKVVPAVRTVGWDVAITPTGPCLIEGNENWDKTLWEMPHPEPLGPVVDRWLAEERSVLSPWALSWSKRGMDVSLAALGLLITAPVTVIVAGLVRARLGSPVIFTQPRPGLAGRTFMLRKFRTMTNETGDDGVLLPRQERLTPFGRRLRASSLDELPELWNVLTGEMSLVGPRPLRVEYLEHYTPRQAARHLVRPGLTGLAQVSGGERLGWDERFELDLEYLRTASFGLDLKILGRTVLAALTRADAEPEGGHFSTAFAGDIR